MGGLFWSDDPERDADRYYNEQEKWLLSRPVCCSCEEHIQDDYAYFIDDEWICEDCLKYFKKEVTS